MPGAARGRLSVVADRNVAYVEQAFAALGATRCEVRPLPSREIDAAAVRDADLLLLRSTVKVGPALLDGSRVRFVATATIGTDHLDLDYLDARGIRWAAAPGSNAPSVAQWFATALLVLAARKGLRLAGLTAGVVGVGNVGRRVAAVLEALGCEVLLCDPPRAQTEGPAGFVTLDELCAAADLVTLHVPLTSSGPDATVRLFDADRIARLRPGAWLVSSCRGPVVDGAALVEAKRAGGIGAAILDVYDGEPNPSPALVDAADLATPHIAGHSLDGKAAGTLAVYQAACAFLGEKPTWTPRRALPPLAPAALAIDARTLDDQAAALAVLRRFYDVERDDAALRAIGRLPDAQRGGAFQRYRDEYPERREPIGVSVQLRPPRSRAAALLASLGAVIRDD